MSLLSKRAKELYKKINKKVQRKTGWAPVARKFVKRILTKEELVRFKKYFRFYHVYYILPGIAWKRYKKNGKRFRKKIVIEGKARWYASFWNVETILRGAKIKRERTVYVGNPFGRALHFRERSKKHDDRRSSNKASSKQSIHLKTRRVKSKLSRVR